MTQLIIQPGGEDADPSDPKWAAAVDELRRALAREVGLVPTPPAEVARNKVFELIAPIILALGSSGAIGAVVAIFNGWLKSGRKRSLKLKMKTGDVEKVVELTSDGLSAGEFEALVKKFGK